MATAGPWSSLQPALHPTLTDALTIGLNFPTMTPVQAAAISPLLRKKDVVVGAETGSGKTLSYLVPIAQTLLHTLRPRPSTSVRALIILPTRELATQVHAVATQLFSRTTPPLTPASLIGGGGPSVHLTAPDLRVLIATPGRLAAALSQNALHIAKLEILVLDEADRLLDMGFAVSLTDILTRLPRLRRTAIYSATQTAELDSLARAGMRNPVRVAVHTRATETVHDVRRVPASLACEFQLVTHRDRVPALLKLLAELPGRKVIVYFLTCASVEYHRRLPLAALLEAAQAAPRSFFALHGRLSQKRRDRALSQFAAADGAVLLATDVAARGLDVPDVDVVVQLDAPQDPDAYIHRVGRTARLGRVGRSVIFLAPSEDAYADFLGVRRCPVQRVEVDVAALSIRVASILQAAVLADRAILEAGEAAFLSYLRAYKEHRCRFLLKLLEVDVNSLADSFALLRLPKFHEFKRLRSGITARNEKGIVIRDIAFKDKVRERRRQEEIRTRIANRAQWKAELAAKKKSKGKGKKRKRKGGEDEAPCRQPGRGKDVAAEPSQGCDDDEEDFGAEAAQLRKVRTGKLSRAAFDAEAGYSDAGDASDTA